MKVPVSFCRLAGLLLCCLCWAGAAQAQQPDSAALQSAKKAKLSVSLPPKDSAAAPLATEAPKKQGFVKRFFAHKYPNPRKAAFLSLALPGAGQAYNKRWWKLPIVYGALGGVIWLEVDNVRQYRKLRDNYRLLVDGDESTNPTESPYDRIDATSMRRYRDQWRRYVEQTSIALGLVYLLTAADAFVDAHLRSFDVSDDLSFRVVPRVQTLPLGDAPVFGVGLHMGF
jgi:hypothetical protein